MAQVEKRVSELESLFKDLLFSQNRVMSSIDQLAGEMTVFKDEMSEFKEEMQRDRKAMREEMSEFKEEMQKDRKAMREEMSEFKEEMSEFKEEMRRDRKEMNKKWGDLANKMGTIVEDLIFPNFHIMLKEYFGLHEPDDIMIRRWKKIKSKGIKKEFDLIAVFEDKKLVFLDETKSTASKEYIMRFSEFVKSGKFFEFFPEYTGYQLVPVFSSIYLEDSLVDLLTKEQIFAVHIEGSILHLKNVDVKKVYNL